MTGELSSSLRHIYTVLHLHQSLTVHFGPLLLIWFPLISVIWGTWKLLSTLCKCKVPRHRHCNSARGRSFFKLLHFWCCTRHLSRLSLNGKAFFTFHAHNFELHGNAEISRKLLVVDEHALWYAQYCHSARWPVGLASAPILISGGLREKAPHLSPSLKLCQYFKGFLPQTVNRHKLYTVIHLWYWTTRCHEHYYRTCLLHSLADVFGSVEADSWTDCYRRTRHHGRMHNITPCYKSKIFYFWALFYVPLDHFIFNHKITNVAIMYK